MRKFRWHVFAVAAAMAASVALVPGDAVAAPVATITFTTTPTPRERYAPKNVVAVWVEDASGGFVKTLLRYANRRVRYLLAWNAVAQDASLLGTAPDAITGATRSNHAPLTVTWNASDFRGAPVPDGDYVIRMELTDQNASSTSANNEGSFQLRVGPDDVDEQGLASGGFNNVSIHYTTDGTPSGGTTTDPAQCLDVVVCVDNDGCCHPDCVFEVDNDCSPTSARGAEGGCDAGDRGRRATAWLVLLSLVVMWRKRSARRAA